MDQRIAPPTYTVKQVCETLGITYNTYLNWERLGVAPRRERIGDARLERVTHEELQRWLQQRQEDRRRTGKWHLRHPLTAGEIAFGDLVARVTEATGQPSVAEIEAELAAQIRRHLQENYGDRLRGQEITDIVNKAIEGARRLREQIPDDRKEKEAAAGRPPKSQ